MNQPQCTICLNNYDSLQHRPRALPCGHGFCTQCIEACIRNEDRNCPICRTYHGKNSVHDLPISFLLEELLDKTASAPYESDEELEASAPYEPDGEPSVDMCPRHKQVPLHFLCKSHMIKVCHSCTVIDHAPPSCVLISLKDLVIEKKRSQIAAVQVQRKKIMILEEDLNCVHQRTVDGVTKHRSRKNELQKEVDLLLAKIEEVDKEIFVIHESQEHIKGAIQSCHAKQKECEVVENKLKATKDTKTIKEEIRNAAEEIIMFQRWEEDLRSEHEMLKNRYAKFERNGIVRSSKVIFEGAKTLIPSLSKEVIPPISAELMQIPKTFKEADVYMISSTTTVFLELSARGAEEAGGDISLGRVEIRVLTDRPIGKQFVMIALGTDGISYKGANFEWKYINSMGLQYYVTEDNTKAEAPLLVTIEKEHLEEHKRGRLFATGANRTGFVIRTSNVTSDPRGDYGYFGDVITGMDVIDRAVSNEIAITDIIISNCGLLVYETA